MTATRGLWELMLDDIRVKTGLSFNYMEFDTKDKRTAEVVLPILAEWVNKTNDADFRGAIFHKFATLYARSFFDQILKWLAEETHRLNIGMLNTHWDHCVSQPRLRTSATHPREKNALVPDCQVNPYQNTYFIANCMIRGSCDFNITPNWAEFRLVSKTGPPLLIAPLLPPGRKLFNTLNASARNSTVLDSRTWKARVNATSNCQFSGRTRVARPRFPSVPGAGVPNAAGFR